MIDGLRVLELLSECTGDDIWSVDHCRQRGIPQEWIDDLADAFESNLSLDRQTIFVDGKVTNQYHGVRDVDLAGRLAAIVGIDVGLHRALHISNRAFVRALQEAVDE